MDNIRGGHLKISSFLPIQDMVRIRADVVKNNFDRLSALDHAGGLAEVVGSVLSDERAPGDLKSLVVGWIETERRDQSDPKIQEILAAFKPDRKLQIEIYAVRAALLYTQYPPKTAEAMELYRSIAERFPGDSELLEPVRSNIFWDFTQSFRPFTEEEIEFFFQHRDAPGAKEQTLVRFLLSSPLTAENPERISYLLQRKNIPLRDDIKEKLNRFIATVQERAGLKSCIEENMVHEAREARP